MSTRKRLNKKKVFYTIIIFILAVLFIITGIKVVNDLSNKQPKQVKKELNEIKPYGYKLDDRDTKIYKKYFNELAKVLKEKEINEEAYAKGLTKLFVVDFYTLDNKLASTDIGSLEFVHKNQVKNFQLNAEETMYKHVKSNLYNERVQELPEVKEVTINNVEKTTYKYNEKDYEAYKVSVSWTYKKDMGYDKKGIYILIKDNDKLNVVDNTQKEDVSTVKKESSN